LVHKAAATALPILVLILGAAIGARVDASNCAGGVGGGADETGNDCNGAPAAAGASRAQSPLDVARTKAVAAMADAKARVEHAEALLRVARRQVDAASDELVHARTSLLQQRTSLAKVLVWRTVEGRRAMSSPESAALARSSRDVVSK